MNSIYKDIDNKNLIAFINTSLDKLGFKSTIKGTIYLKNFILFAFLHNYDNINIEQIVIDYIAFNNITTTKRTFISNIEYSIYNTDFNKFKNNFYSVFNIDYDIYYKSTRNIVILLITVLNNKGIF